MRHLGIRLAAFAAGVAVAAALFAAPSTAAEVQALNGGEVLGAQIDTFDMPTYCNAVRDDGPQGVSLVLTRGAIEANNGTLDKTVIDNRVNALRNCGIQVAIRVKPTSNSTQKSFLPTGTELDQYLSLLTQLATYLQGRVSRYAIDNEAASNSHFQGSADDYFELVRRSSAAIKAGDPTAEILDATMASSNMTQVMVADLYAQGRYDEAISLAQETQANELGTGTPVTNMATLTSYVNNSQTQRSISFYQGAVANQSSYDAFQLHYYGPWRSMINMYDFVRSHGITVPIETWEVAHRYRDGRPFAEDDFAAETARLTIAAAGEGSAFTIFSSYLGNQTNGAVGLFDWDGTTSHLARSSFRTVVSQITGATSAERLDLSGDAWGYRFERPGKPAVFAVWADPDPELIGDELGVNAATAQVTPSVGAPYTADLSTLEAGLTPIFIVPDAGTTRPDTTISSGPSGTINTATAAFEFSSDASGATFECKLDGDSFSSCSSPKSYGSLGDGPHTFSVRATSSGGTVDPTPATRSFTVDATAPETTIDSGPSGTITTASADFGFSSADNTASFECKLDSGGFSSCSSPKTYSGLADGPHTFTVKATDPAGNTESSPPSRTFTVDTTAPTTTIDSGPSGTITTASADFGFSSTDNTASFECKLDSGGFSSCSSPKTYSSLGDGPHTFTVKATDPAGNAESSPPSRSFTVDTTAPTTTIDTGPGGTTSNRSPQFTYHSSESGSSFECSLDTGTADWHPCDGSGFTPASPLTDGDYTFRVRATDAPGNTDASPATRTFTVDATSPQTTIDTGPTDTTTSRSPQFTYHSSESGSSFECSLDSGTADWHACDGAGFTPATPLADGDYTFRVRATDGPGNVDQSAATRTFTVDATPPDTTIDTGPTGTTTSPSPQFTYHSSESGSSFECSLDTGIAAWQTCGSSFTPASPLSDGSYTFRVRATDGAGNVDASAATRTFTVKQATTPPPATAPETTITDQPKPKLKTKKKKLTVKFGFTSDTAGAQFTCTLDGKASSCESPAKFKVKKGSHEFEVAATSDGLTDQSPATFKFKVKPKS